MKKYTRKQINKNASLHDKEFITLDDALEIIEKFADAAIKAGANERGLLEFLKGEGDE